MPSGALMIEQGRPLRCPIIHVPTSSKYRARSSLVTSPSPSSGHRTLSGWLRETPITTPSPEADDEVLARVAVSRVRVRRHRCCRREPVVSASTSFGRFVLTQSFECRLPDHAAAGEAREFDLRHELRLEPMHAGLLARGILAAERILLRSGRLERWHQARNLFDAESSSDIADIDQVVAAVHASHQRPELASVAVPATDNHLMSGAAFGLRPAIATSGSIPCVSLFRDDAFQGHPASRLEDGVSAALEMLDVSDLGLILAVDILDERSESTLSIRERLSSQVRALEEEKVEGEEDQVIGLPLGQGCLQPGEIGRTAMIEGDDLTVDQAIR